MLRLDIYTVSVEHQNPEVGRSTVWTVYRSGAEPSLFHSTSIRDATGGLSTLEQPLEPSSSAGSTRSRVLGFFIEKSTGSPQTQFCPRRGSSGKRAEEDPLLRSCHGPSGLGPWTIRASTESTVRWFIPLFGA